MNKTIDRRSFLKAVGIAALAPTIPVVFSGCGKDGYGSLISVNELSNYNLVVHYTNDNKTEQKAFLVRHYAYHYYVKSDEERFVVLTSDGDGIIYPRRIDTYSTKEFSAESYNAETYEEAQKRFDEKHFVISSEPAILAVEERIGIKSSYTAEELNEMIEEINQELNQKPKQLIKEQ